MPDTIHLVKLCVGVSSVEELIAYRDAAAKGPNPEPFMHVTRMWPKKGDALLNGGSLYWVIKGEVQLRQRVIELREIIDDEGIRRCGLVLDPEMVRVRQTPRRAFQGWRYLAPTDAPADLPKQRAGDDKMPDEMQRALSDLGLF